MAFSNITTPSEIVFSGNPVIFSGESSIRSQQFATVTAKAYVRKNGNVIYTEEYTYPLADDGKFQFDMSGVLAESFRQLLHAATDPTNHDAEVLTYYITLTEEYFSSGVRRTGSSVKKGEGTNEPTYYALPGGNTEYERHFRDIENTKEYIGSGMLLTRKPDAEEMVIERVVHMLPYVQVDRNGVPRLYCRKTTRTSAGTYAISISGVGSRRVYAQQENIMYFPLIFVNSYGTLESAVAVSSPSYEKEVASQQYEEHGERSFSSVGMPLSRTSVGATLMHISSGLVSRAWAEWWISDVLTSPMTWILVDGRYIPCAVVPEKSYKYDTADDEALSVDFAVRINIKGTKLW